LVVDLGIRSCFPAPKTLNVHFWILTMLVCPQREQLQACQYSTETLPILKG
jgi:hypothetical protein